MPKAFRIFHSVRFDLDEILTWLEQKGSLQTVKEMKADQWVNDVSGGATIESMKAERGLLVNNDEPVDDINLVLATMGKLLEEHDEITAGELSEESYERLLKVRDVFESLREKISPSRERI